MKGSGNLLLAWKRKCQLKVTALAWPNPHHTSSPFLVADPWMVKLCDAPGCSGQ